MSESIPYPFQRGYVVNLEDSFDICAQWGPYDTPEEAEGKAKEIRDGLNTKGVVSVVPTLVKGDDKEMELSFD